MSSKTERREVIESGSPLRLHSLNQRNIKSDREGRKRLGNTRGKSDLGSFPVLSNEQDGREVLLSALNKALPLSLRFREAMLPLMINHARARTDQESQKPDTIPQRLINITIDVGRIYRQAKQTGCHLEIIEPPLGSVSDRKLSLRQELVHYTGIFQMQLFLIMLRQLSIWRPMAEQEKTFLSTELPKALLINLTSCRFNLVDIDELVGERVETYGYMLSTLGELGLRLRSLHFSRGVDVNEFVDSMSLSYLGALRGYPKR